MRRNKEVETASSHRNWADLSGPPLVLILDRLLLFADLFALGSVCSSWRSLFLHSPARKDAHKSRPPMILLLVDKDTCQGATRFQLTHPTSNPAAVSYGCMISSPTLSSGFCIGSSFGNLILFANRRVIIADLFTGSHTVSENLFAAS